MFHRGVHATNPRGADEIQTLRNVRLNECDGVLSRSIHRFQYLGGIVSWFLSINLHQVGACEVYYSDLVMGKTLDAS